MPSITSRHWPQVGQRMIKTAIAVFVCLLIYRLMGYQGSTMPVESVITAIVCMQPFISDSRAFALNRIAGTLMGAAWGMAFLLLLYGIPPLGQNVLVLYALMAAGVLVSVYTAVSLGKADASGLAAIVFICIVATFPDIDSPLIDVIRRIRDVMIGMTVAIAINVAQMPREKQRDKVFFVPAKTLVPNRFAKIPPTILYRMNRLYEDGAKICLVLEHAPALFTMQMSSCHVSVPLIVMDGAAIFDTNENRYLYAERIPKDQAIWLQEWLRERGVSYFTYIIRENRTCIFHEGTINEQELTILKQMQRSPYRSYLEGDDFRPEESVYFKVIAPKETLVDVEIDLIPLLSERGLRSVVRDQTGSDGIQGLYIYSEKASSEKAKDYLMTLLQIKEPHLRAVDITSRREGYDEQETARMLHRLRNAYEPVKLFKHIF